MSTIRTRVGLLHTVPALAARFDGELAAVRPEWQQLHVVDAPLLATAIAEGVTDEVTERTRAHIEHLARQGAAAILVTCSSIGEAVEAAATSVPVAVVRVDVAMATDAVDLAVRAGVREGRPGKIIVLATLEATLGPTGRLLDRLASVSERHPVVQARIVNGAVEARNAGDQVAHDALIANAIADAADADVVVLAQASMAAAADQAAASVPVLSSPQSAQRALLHAVESSRS